jgi:hypothetical protein
MAAMNNIAALRKLHSDIAEKRCGKAGIAQIA